MINRLGDKSGVGYDRFMKKRMFKTFRAKALSSFVDSALDNRGNARTLATSANIICSGRAKLDSKTRKTSCGSLAAASKTTTASRAGPRKAAFNLARFSDEEKKNKHGAELGEFVDVVKKKPKKRLALPTNFVLKPQGEQEVDEYHDKEEGGGDDYFDKKEWSATGTSDPHPESSEANKPEVDKTDPAKLADIDGIVNIITKQEAHPIQSEDKIKFESVEDKSSENKKESEELKELDDVKEEKHEGASDSKVANTDTKKYDDYDYEEKEKTSKEKLDQSESEAKKAKILDSVDELKERHAEEQRQISEKIKEEELFKDEQERNLERFPRREYDKYDLKEPEWRKGSSEYDEYDEKLLDVRDKYKIVAKKSVVTTPKPKAVEQPPPINKISLFSNPNAFLIRDYEESEEKPTTGKPKRNKNAKDETSQKFSSRYLEADPKDKGRVRISLVPEEKDSKEGEPTLFFPKKRLGRTWRAWEEGIRGGCTARVRWLAERKFLTSASLGKHEDTKTKKGYHDRENHIGKYDDQGGIDKDHHDESQHYGHHHHEEHGKKHAKYEESGKHSKGHSTKGSHDIHKKEEYEKNVEFFEEEGDDDEEETHGGHHDEKSHAEGGLFKKENLESGHEGHTKGDTGHYSKGGFGHYNKGHKSSGGHDGHGRHGRENHHTEGKDAGKKWIYHHGAPARTAHLKPIDRADPRLFRPRFF
ncbi:PREDICTED: putative golgin subfamily A member 6-like protein 6 [Papilio xuthus]|uniref:Golgin subfamily A member 6-like protein 6 n=1 Tax=Papilio xuthus TaxID=66420 RepID=A0AAJ7EC30_PAPXU|nr:PREDICTED: putative golgin subfamily A member 6-like protein 6 [Papilio xuthus]